MSFSQKGFLVGIFLVGIAVLPALLIASGTTTTSHPAYQWHTFLGGDANVEANQPASAVDAAGNLYITGLTGHPWDQSGNPQAASEPSARGYLAKISPTGQLLWSKFFGTPGADVDPVAITLDSAGNIYIGGAYWPGLGGTGCSFVIETDPNGNMLWGTNFGGWNYLDTTVLGLTYDPVGNWVYVTGWASTRWFGGTPLNGLPTNGAFAMFIAQVGSVTQGEAIGWVGFYYTAPGNSGGTMGRSIAVDADSNLYVAGADGDHAAVWKVSGKGPTAGQQIWERIYGSSPSYSYGVAVHGSNVYATGYSAVPWKGPDGQDPRNAFVGSGGAVAFVLKLDTGGNFLWHTFYPGSDVQSWGKGIAVDGPNKVYVVGPGHIVGPNGAAPQHDTPTGTGGHFILQLDDLGYYQWHSIYGFLGSDTAFTIAVDPLHNIFVSGTTGWGTFNGDGNTGPLHPASGFPSEIFVMRFATAAPAPTTTTASTPPTLTYSPGSQNINLSASVTSQSPVNSGTVAFTLLGTTVSASVAGGWATTAFTVPGGASAGSYPMQATYNPGEGLAASSDNGLQLAISKATPAIAWSNPADIFFGTALGSTQLNPTANMPGAFVYTPTPGTVLPVGNGQTLSTTFTPADATNYNTATRSVQITVKQVSPPASPAQIVVTKTLRRNNNQVVVSLNISNAGGADAMNVQVTVGKMNTTSGTPLPQSLGTVVKGGTVTATLTFPGSAGTPGTVGALTVGGTYTGGSFSSASRVTIP